MGQAVKLKHDGENWSEWRESIQKIAKRKRLANYLVGTPPEPFKDIFNSLARRIIECTVPKSISNHFRHYATAWECIDYLTKRFDKARWSEQVKMTPCEKVTERVGEKGETPHRRDNEAAAATGLGKTTTDHQWTDSRSLTTLASGPRDDQKVILELVKPLLPPPSVESTTPPKQTQPHANESRENSWVVVDRDDNDEDCRVHKCADDPANGADTSTDETTAIATATASTDTAAPHHAPNTPLEGEQSGQESTGEVGARTEVGEGEDGGEKGLPDEFSQPTEPASPPDEAKAIRDQGHHLTKTIVSASSDHQDAMTTDPHRLSRDPADATGNDECCPEAPTEPPDKPEGTRRRWGDERAETGVPELSRVVQESPDEDGSDKRRPGMPDEAPDEPSHEMPDPSAVQVEPGGETDVEPGGSVAHEDADATVNNRAEEAHGDVQGEAERLTTCQNAPIEGERQRAPAHARSTTTDENNQPTSQDDDDIPRAPPEPPPPLTSPDETTRSQDQPPSVELEGERKGVASCDAGPTTGDADMAGVPGGDEDARKQPKKPRNTLEHIRGHLERKDGENSPGRARDELGNPSGEAHASGASEGDKDPRNRHKMAQNALEQARERSKGRSREDSPRAAQADPNDPRHEADASQASGSIEGTSTTANELQKVSECERKCSERCHHENSPSRPREVPYDPGGETAVPGGIHNVQEGPEGVRNERADETDASGRVTGPGGYLELQGRVESRRGRLGPPEHCRRRRIQWETTQEHQGRARHRNEHVTLRWRPRRASRQGRQVGRYRRRTGAPKRWRRCRDGRDRVLNGWRNERHTARLETSRNATASWSRDRSAPTAQPHDGARTSAIHTTSQLCQVTLRLHEPTALMRTHQNEI